MVHDTEGLAQCATANRVMTVRCRAASNFTTFKRSHVVVNQLLIHTLLWFRSLTECPNGACMFKANAPPLETVLVHHCMAVIIFDEWFIILIEWFSAKKTLLTLETVSVIRSRRHLQMATDES